MLSCAWFGILRKHFVGVVFAHCRHIAMGSKPVCCLVLFFATSYVTGQVTVNGGWGAWQEENTDCCLSGGLKRSVRYCNNPYPQGSGTKCTTTAGEKATQENKFTSCACTCSTPCDSKTAFCVNDTLETPPYCECNYGYSRSLDSNDTSITFTCIAPPSDDANVTESSSEITDDGNLTDADVSMSRISTLSDDTNNALDIARIFTCAWVLIFLMASMIVHIVYMNFTFGRIIHMNQEICLIFTYAFLAIFIEHTDNSNMCRLASACIQYFFLCCMTFFSLESLQTYSIVTYVIPRDGYLHGLLNLALGYGVPAVVVAVCLPLLWDTYGQNGLHCWCDMGSNQAWAFLLPLCIGLFAATVLGEAQDQGHYDVLDDIDRTQFKSAKSSQHTMFYVMYLVTITYLLGLVATDLEKIPCFALFYTGNIIFGPVLLICHAFSNQKVEDLMMNVLGMMCPCWFKDKRRAAAATVAPTSHEILQNDWNAADGDSLGNSMSPNATDIPA